MGAVAGQQETIPRIGLGTWEITGGEATRAVEDALDLGYRHIDTARVYDNEADVGKGVARSPVDRSEVWITTKLWFEELRREQVRIQLERSLFALDTDYVDLLLIHWPNPRVPIAETLEAMAAEHQRGRVRAIGVSNFPTRELAEAIDASPLPLAANQVEYHPFIDQSAVIELARRHEVAITAYSPLAHGEVVGERTLAEIGANHGRSAAQVALRWLLDQEGVGVVPRSASHENRAANIDLDFELDVKERSRIDALVDPAGRQIDPSFAPAWD